MICGSPTRRSQRILESKTQNAKKVKTRSTPESAKLSIRDTRKKKFFKGNRSDDASRAINKSSPVWWEERFPDQIIHSSLKNIHQIAFEVAENIALNSMSKMCRQGPGWNFPQQVYVDRRMRHAEYTVDVEAEIGRLSFLLSKVYEMKAAHRPGSLILFHVAMKDAWKAFEEPMEGMPWDAIVIAHKCLDSSWYDQASQATIFGLSQKLTDIWIDTIRSLRSDAAPPPRYVLDSIAEFTPLLEHLFIEESQTPFSVAIFDALEDNLRRDAEAKVRTAVELKEAEEVAVRKQNELHVTARSEGKIPGIDVCYLCCTPINGNGDYAGLPYLELNWNDEDFYKTEDGFYQCCIDCLPSDDSIEY